MTEFGDWEGEFWKKRLPGNLDSTLVEHIRKQLWPWARTYQFYRRSGGTVKAVYHAGCAFSPTVQLSIQVGHIIVGSVCILIRLIIFRI